MKTCAKCHKEYADNYDACPACVEAEQKTSKAAVGCTAAACGPFMLMWIIGIVVLVVVALSIVLS